MKKKITATPKTIIVFNGDKNKTVEITSDFQMKAFAAMRQLQAGYFLSALAIKQIVDEELFLAMNISTKDQFLSTLEFINRTSAYRLYGIAKKFTSAFGNNLMIKDEAGRLIPSDEVNQFTDLGINKLNELVRLDDEELSELAKGKTVNINGTNLDLDDIRKNTFKELEAAFKNREKKQSAEIALLREENKILKSESNLNEEKQKLADKKLTHAKELEAKYEPLANNVETKTYLLKSAAEHLDEFTDVIHKADIKETDPVRLQEEVKSLLRKIDTQKQILFEKYHELIMEM